MRFTEFQSAEKDGIILKRFLIFLEASIDRGS
jgi:hypothetical protein